MKTIRITAAAVALGLMVAGSAMAQQAPQAQQMPQDLQQQRHPDQGTVAPQPGTGMMGGPMMQHMMQHMMGGGGMMGPGMMGPGMMGMGPGMMGGGYGMMGPGMMMGGMMPCGGAAQQAAVEVTPEIVQKYLEGHVAMTGNDRLKVGEVTKRDDGTIVATIVTKNEGAVVDQFAIDPKTHMRQRID